jgi:hypothetical protein
VQLVVSFLESYSKLDLKNPCVRNNSLSDCSYVGHDVESLNIG